MLLGLPGPVKECKEDFSYNIEECILERYEVVNFPAWQLLTYNRNPSQASETAGSQQFWIRRVLPGALH